MWRLFFLGSFLLACLLPNAATGQYASVYAEGLRRDVRSSDGSVWFHLGTQRNTVVVFVHGILSNPLDCWAFIDSQHHRRAYWPEIVERDTAFRDPSIFLAEYHTGVTSGNYDIAQAARDLWNALNDPDSSGRRVLDATNLLFVTHSMGGIVVRRLLTQYVGALQDKTIGLALIASPSMGSRYASSFAPVARFARNQMAIQLQPLRSTGNENRFLYDLDQDFRALLYNRTLRLDGFEACENEMVVSRFLPTRHLVVDPESCSRYFGRTIILPHTNHFTSVKPSSPTANVHQELVRFYRTRFRPLVEMNPRLHLDSIQVRPVFDTAIVTPAEVRHQVDASSCDEATVSHRHTPPPGYTLVSVGTPVLTSRVNASVALDSVVRHGDTAVVTMHIQATRTGGTCGAPGSASYAVTLVLEKAVAAALPYKRVAQTDLTPSQPSLRIFYPTQVPANARDVKWEFTAHITGSTGRALIDAQLTNTRATVAGVVASERRDGVSVDARSAFSPVPRQE